MSTFLIYCSSRTVFDCLINIFFFYLQTPRRYMKKIIIRNANYNCNKHCHLACPAALANVMAKSHLRRKGCVLSYRLQFVIKGFRARMQRKHGTEFMEELGLLPGSRQLPKGSHGMGPSVTVNTQDAGPSSVGWRQYFS